MKSDGMHTRYETKFYGDKYHLKIEPDESCSILKKVGSEYFPINTLKSFAAAKRYFARLVL